MLDRQQLKKHGLKITMPRLKVLHVFEQSKHHHLSAESVYNALISLGEEISLATVYRVLTQFETAGLLCRHRFESGHSVFELSQGAHHDHLVCVQCGRVDEFMDDIIEQRQKKIAERIDFKMRDHALTIYGYCVACQ